MDEDTTGALEPLIDDEAKTKSLSLEELANVINRHQSKIKTAAKDLQKEEKSLITVCLFHGTPKARAVQGELSVNLLVALWEMRDPRSTNRHMYQQLMWDRFHLIIIPAWERFGDKSGIGFSDKAVDRYLKVLMRYYRIQESTRVLPPGSRCSWPPPGY